MAFGLRSGPGITRSAPGADRGVGEAPGVGVEHRARRAGCVSASRTPIESTVMAANVCR